MSNSIDSHTVSDCDSLSSSGNSIYYLSLQVYNVNKAGSRESKSPWGQFTETVKEKFETVRGRRYSKEQGER